MEPSREQADLPAQQPSPREDARVPAADAHPGGPGDPGRASPQGTPRAVRLTGQRAFAEAAVLPAANRMRRSRDFDQVINASARARRGAVVVQFHATLRAPSAAPLVGLVVGKSVGGSVVRHRVSRKLRAQLSRRLVKLPPGSGTVVRALPPSATASSAALGADVDAALRRVLPGQVVR
jgi:ribonuclease P protein component